MAVTISGLSSSPTSGTLSSPGIGSGLDVNGIVSKLMQVEQQPLIDLQQKEAGYQAKLSAVGTLKGAVSSLQTAMASLSDASQFGGLTATVGDSTVLSASASTGAAAGSYNVAVTTLAQAQTLSSAGMADTTSTVGSGNLTFTIQFGTYSGGVGGSFTLNPNQGAQTITLSSTQNSLTGIRDAINGANIGVSASIINDGSTNGYHLVLTSATGAANAMRVSTTDAGLAAAIAYDGTQAANPATNPATQTIAAQDASFTVNGVAITKPSNTVTDAIQGVTLNLLKQSSSSTLTLAKNTSGLQSAVQNFVNAYNAAQKALSSASSYDPKTKQAGPLLGDPSVLSIESQLTRTLNTAIASPAGGLSSLFDIGISFQKDGTLTLDTTKLQSVMNDSTKDISTLFAAVGKASDSLISVTDSGTSTQPGNYAVSISQLATRGTATGTGTAPANPTTINASNNTLAVTVDNNAVTVTLRAGTYTPAQLAAEIQSEINGNSTVSGAGSSVAITVNGSGQLVLTSSRWGSASNVSINGGTAAAAAGLDTTSTTAGVDVAGTIGGQTASGSGQVLTGTAGASGLALTIAGGSTGDRGVVTFSQGYAYQLNQLTTSMLDTNGLLAAETNAINQSITDTQNQQTIVQQRLTQIEARYRAQFNNLDTLIASMQATQSFLSQQLAGLNSLAYGTTTSTKTTG